MVDGALRAGGFLTAGVDPRGFLRGAALLGQPAFQPGQGLGQGNDLAAASAQLVQSGGGLLELARADQPLGQQRPPQSNRVRPATAVQGHRASGPARRPCPGPRPRAGGAGPGGRRRAARPAEEARRAWKATARNGCRRRRWPGPWCARRPVTGAAAAARSAGHGSPRPRTPARRSSTSSQAPARYWSTGAAVSGLREGTPGRPQQLIDDAEVQIGLGLVGASRKHSRPATSVRQCRARAVFPTPGSPSMATIHGCAWLVDPGGYLRDARELRCPARRKGRRGTAGLARALLAPAHGVGDPKR